MLVWFYLSTYAPIAMYSHKVYSKSAHHNAAVAIQVSDAPAFLQRSTS